MRVTFRQVGMTGVKYIVIDGKRRRRQKRFWQSLNPYNKNPDGTIKTHADIVRALEVEIAAWQADQVPS